MWSLPLARLVDPWRSSCLARLGREIRRMADWDVMMGETSGMWDRCDNVGRYR